jgi:hypothetical protein
MNDSTIEDSDFLSGEISPTNIHNHGRNLATLDRATEPEPSGALVPFRPELASNGAIVPFPPDQTRGIFTRDRAVDAGGRNVHDR